MDNSRRRWRRSLRWCAALLAGVTIVPALAQPDAPVSAEDELIGYCLGVNRQFVERFRRIQLWGCGRAPGMEWCREAKTNAAETMRQRELLVMRFAKVLSDKGLFDAGQPVAVRNRLTHIVADGSNDAALCFNEKGTKDEAACERLQRCAEAEKMNGM